MPDASIQSRLQTHFPALCDALPHISASAYKLIEVPSNTTIFDVGGACEQYLLLTEGTISVKMLSKSGKSILLYRVKPGQSCIITTACLLSSTHYPTFGETDTQIEAIGLSQLAFNKALDQSSPFRQFVFDSLGQRLADVMARLESVNFTSIDSRIATALLAHGEASRRVAITHEVLAEEVGSAREVISRHLKKLESRGLIQLERGVIILKERNRLDELCE